MPSPARASAAQLPAIELSPWLGSPLSAAAGDAAAAHGGGGAPDSADLLIGHFGHADAEEAARIARAEHERRQEQAEAAAQRRFFLFLAFNAPHLPTEGVPPEIDKCRAFTPVAWDGGPPDPSGVRYNAGYASPR